MARITVEDCLEQIPNLFELTNVASKRARRVANGAEPLVGRENDKATVIALREIAAGKVTRYLLDEADTVPEDTISREKAEAYLRPAPHPDSYEDDLQG